MCSARQALSTMQLAASSKTLLRAPLTAIKFLNSVFNPESLGLPQMLSGFGGRNARAADLKAFPIKERSAAFIIRNSLSRIALPRMQIKVRHGKVNPQRQASFCNTFVVRR